MLDRAMNANHDRGAVRRTLTRCQLIIRLALTDGTPLRAARLAVVVGTLLVLINQWEALWGASELNWLKVALTYVVPYLVSTFTSVSKDLPHALAEMDVRACRSPES